MIARIGLGAGWLAAVLALAAVATAAAELKNSSFEESSDPENWFSDQALHWSRWGNWINRETGWQPMHQGECLIGYHHWRIQENDPSGLYQDVEDIPAGKECSFCVYAYKDADTNVEYIELRLEPLGGGDAVASQRYRMGDIPRDRWKLLTVSGRAPAAGIRVLIVVQPETKGERMGAIKFDEASLVCE